MCEIRATTPCSCSCSIRSRMKTPQIYFDHEKLVAYQRSIQFVVWANPILENVSSKVAVHDHLDRASTSVPLKSEPSLFRLLRKNCGRRVGIHQNAWPDLRDETPSSSPNLHRIGLENFLKQLAVIWLRPRKIHRLEFMLRCPRLLRLNPLSKPILTPGANEKNGAHIPVQKRRTESLAAASFERPCSSRDSNATGATPSSSATAEPFSVNNFPPSSPSNGR
jgi:hypothetical protein